jgi:hypothetical protein
MSLCKPESNDNENKILVAFNKEIPLSTILDLTYQEENRKILDSKKPIKTYFQSCYNDQSAICVSNFRFLERYFENIKDQHPQIFKSVTELFEDANDYPRIIFLMKKTQRDNWSNVSNQIKNCKPL